MTQYTQQALEAAIKQAIQEQGGQETSPADEKQQKQQKQQAPQLKPKAGGQQGNQAPTPPAQPVAPTAPAQQQKAPDVNALYNEAYKEAQAKVIRQQAVKDANDSMNLQRMQATMASRAKGAVNQMRWAWFVFTTNPLTAGLALLAQVGSWITTFSFVYALVSNVAGEGVEGVQPTAIFVSLALELVLMALKSRVDVSGMFAYIFDTGLNFGGLWPYVKHVDKTPMYKALADAFKWGENAAMPSWLVVAAGFSFALGLSVAPHILWKRAQPR